MPEILSLNNFHLAKNGVRLVYGDTTVYNLHLDQAIGGTITANRMSGNRGDVVTLYNNPSAGYSFDNYSVTGSTLTGVQIRFMGEDIYVSPSFTHNVYNINLQQTTGGSITSDKSTGYYGDTVTLSNTPAEHYGFRDYSITGATLTGNQFTINESNVTAKANFYAWPVRNVSVQQRTGGTIASNKSTGYDGDVVTLSNTADAGYTFTNYNVTGATLTGNQFAFNGGNVTAQGAFNHNVYNLTLQQTNSGTITADKTTGYYGDTVTLSNSPSAGYGFDYYSITGATLTGDKFKFNTKNVTAKANFVETLPPYTLRLKYKQGETPWITSGTATLVDATNNIWDYTYNNQNWSEVLMVNAITDILSANVSGVKYFKHTFASCTALSSVCPLQTSNCRSFYEMFDYCISLKSIPLFDMSNASGLAYYSTFNSCSSLTSLPAFVFGPSANLAYTFSGCRSLKTLPLFDTSRVRNFGATFRDCTSLTSVPKFNTSSVTGMGNMFAHCYSLKSVPVFDTSNVKNIVSMFSDCHALTSLPSFNLSKIEDCRNYAWKCYNVQSGALYSYRQLSGRGMTLAQHNQTFYQCGVSSRTGSAELAQIPSDWK